MNYKISVIFLLIVIFLPLISPNDLKVSLKPHFFLNGSEYIYSSDLNFTELSFDIIGKNTNLKYRILNISIKGAYPKEFKDSLPNTTEKLRILQKKQLWTSKLIDVRNFSGENVTFLIEIQGVEDDKKYVYDGDYLEIMIKIPSNKSTLIEDNKSPIIKFGEFLWQGNPHLGIIFFTTLVFWFIFFWWKEDGWGINKDFRNFFRKDERNVKRWWRRNVERDIEDAERWKKHEEMKRKEREAEEEGWK